MPVAVLPEVSLERLWKGEIADPVVGAVITDRGPGQLLEGERVLAEGRTEKPGKREI